MNIADIIILVLLFVWGAVAIRSMFRRKKCGGCQGCNGSCKAGSCPGLDDKVEQKSDQKHMDKSGI